MGDETSRRQPLRASSVRAANAELVLDRLKHQTAMTRAELARDTSLTSQALGPILAELVAAGLVIEQISQRPGPGRPPSEFRVDPRGMVTIDLIIRSADYYVMVIDALGETLVSAQHRHTSTRSPTHLISQIATSIRQLLASAGLDHSPTITIAMSVEGIVDEAHQLVVESLAWHEPNVAVGELLIAHLGEKVTVEISSTEHSLATRCLELIDTSPSDLVAIILLSHQPRLMTARDGAIISNRRGDSGVLNHFPIQGNDRCCRCGRIGCFATVTGEAAVIQNYLDLTGKRVTAGVDLIDLIRAGDAQAKKAANQMLEWLGRGLAPHLRLLRPDHLVVTGAVGRPEGNGSKHLVTLIRSHLDPDQRDLAIQVVQPYFNQYPLATTLLS